MSAVAVQPSPWAVPPSNTHRGLGTYFGFVWRRNWVRGFVWFLVTVGMYAFVAVFYLNTAKSTPTFLDNFADIVKAPALATMVGVIDHPATLGGAVWCKGWMFFSLMFGIGILYLMTRNLRGDEEAGRLELMRANPLGARSPLMASVIFCSLVSVVVGLFTALSFIGVDAMVPQFLGADAPAAFRMALGGSFAFGASVMAIGLLGVGIAAITNQIAPSDGAANGLGIGLFALFYIIRAAGDYVITDHPGLRQGLLWASPIGWGELVDPWGDNKVLPIVLMVVFSAVLVFIGWLVATRRDISASLVDAKSGPANATKITQTVPGLALRTQRASIIVWLVGLVIFGGILGSVVTKMKDLVGGMDKFAGLTGDSVAVHIFFMLPLAIGIFAVQSASTLRTEEERGVMESQLAGGVSRVGWALKRLAVTLVAVLVMMLFVAATVGEMWAQAAADPTKVTMALQTIFAHLPAVLLLTSVPVLGLGLWPRQAAAVSWTVVGAMWALAILGLTVLPEGVRNLIPFAGGPYYPVEPMNWTKEIVFLAIAVVFVVVGLIGFRRRNVPTI